MKIFEYTVLTKQNIRLKALVLSDLHIFDIKDILSVEKQMMDLKKKKYDVIYLVGDIIDATNPLRFNTLVTGKLLNLIAYLGYVAPTFIVYGSHDLAYYSHSLGKEKGNMWLADEVTFREKFLNKIANYQGINVLENETRAIKGGYTVSGFNPSLNYAINTPDGDISLLLSESEKYRFINQLDPTKTNTLLCHYPNVILGMYERGLLKNIDLSVAGHNHNGMTQFRLIPLEKVLNLFGQNNRGLITPGKSIKLSDTECLRGVVKLDNRNSLVINPSYKSLAACTGVLEKFDWMFYKGATSIEYVPDNEDEVVLKKV